MAPSGRRNFFFFQKWVGKILGSKVPSCYMQHRFNSRRGIAGLSCSLLVALQLAILPWGVVEKLVPSMCNTVSEANLCIQ